MQRANKIFPTEHSLLGGVRNSPLECILLLFLMLGCVLLLFNCMVAESENRCLIIELRSCFVAFSFLHSDQKEANFK
jgi:hypothetical protein